MQDNARALSAYYDTLLDNSFGNFRALLKAVTLTPAMGVYLNMQGNDKGNIITGTHANENYAREINQLFSIGLNRLWPDGTLVLNSQGNLVADLQSECRQRFRRACSPAGIIIRPTRPMAACRPVSVRRQITPTRWCWCRRIMIWARNCCWIMSCCRAALGRADEHRRLTNFDNYCSQDLEQALDSIFNNQNVGPFICRQLIQRLVTSNPSRDYLYRVVQKFNDNGTGVRGDMQAVVKAILLDYEARSTNLLARADLRQAARTAPARHCRSRAPFPRRRPDGEPTARTARTITITTPTRTG